MRKLLSEIRLCTIVKPYCAASLIQQTKIHNANVREQSRAGDHKWKLSAALPSLSPWLFFINI